MGGKIIGDDKFESNLKTTKKIKKNNNTDNDSNDNDNDDSSEDSEKDEEQNEFDNKKTKIPSKDKTEKITSVNIGEKINEWDIDDTDVSSGIISINIPLFKL